MSIRIFLAAFIILSTVAQGKSLSYESMMTPGAKLLLGDASKGEFSIVAPEKTVPAEVKIQREKQPPLFHPIHQGVMKKRPSVKFAQRRSMHHKKSKYQHLHTPRVALHRQVPKRHNSQIKRHLTLKHATNKTKHKKIQGRGGANYF